eukprot:TRINITY_DN9653_c0_g2_i2.p1 TRINITY_DN9653_c0_g2~~TRINITY_DN9653_c0_g2_i2.p1  ORF type:complete len:549 (+),score=102.94 TRINITY_DN9653_c0_g2_i2:51-1697(+)
MEATSLAEAWKKVPDESVVEFLKRQHAVKVWMETILKEQLDEDLSRILKSGVVLCYLMKKFDERSIPQIHEDTTQIFKQKDNIYFFLAACKDLGVPDYKLFRFNDLWEGDNMVAVVECLAELALIVEREYEEAPHFSIDPKWEPPEINNAEKIKLKKLMSKLRNKPVAGQRVKISKNVVLQKLKILAGNGVDLKKMEPGFVRFQSVLRGHLQRQKHRAMVRNVAYRDHVAREILSTEKFYVESLKQLITVWLAPLNTASKPALKADEVMKIFSNIEIIYQLQTQLYESIQMIVKDWHTFACMGSIFLQIMDFLKVYAVFVQNFTQSLAVLERVQKRKEVANYFEECKRHPGGGSLDLPSFLIMPVQRIPRYNLLLTDMVKHTWPGHPDYENLRSATERISEIAGHINERKREGEKMQKLLFIANHLGGKHRLELVAPGRTFVLEGLFNEGSKEEVIGFLFNDLLVLAKPERKGAATTKYLYKDSVQLAVVQAQDLGPGKAFEIQKLGQKGKVLFRLEATSENDKRSWLDAIRDVKSDLTQRLNPKKSA